MMDRERHILIVDDDTDFAESLGDLLELQGHSFAIASEGLHAVELAAERPFDLVFLDIKMPGIDGVETLRRLQKVQRNVKVAVVTGYATDKQLDDVVAAGAFTVLAKPCPYQRLLDVVNRADSEQIVLVADDDPDFTDMLAELLPAPGRRVLTASKALAAIDMLDQERISVLLLDMRLAGTDGYEVLAALKARRIAIPVIVVTSYPFAEEELRNFEDSVAGVLQKPVPMRRLVEAISTVTYETSMQENQGST